VNRPTSGKITTSGGGGENEKDWLRESGTQAKKSVGKGEES